jgi:hypothetical protein
MPVYAMTLKKRHVGQELGIEIMLGSKSKKCPRCGKTFECQPSSILLCQCSAIKLTEEERALIQTQYQECLCIQCLEVLKEQIKIQGQPQGLPLRDDL